MSTRAASSRVVSRGTLRVDARRARQKVREHLLVDLHLYLLELVRSASAASASRIAIEHDADDLWIAWDGRPPPDDAVVRLLDHLFDDASQGPRVAMLRLLALGVNAALGLGPRYVDVLTRTEGAPKAARVRWTPALLDAAEGQHPEIERTTAPRLMNATGTCVHVRRALGMGVVKRALGETPRELELLAGATHEQPIPIFVGGRPLERPARPATLVRTRLEVRGARRAWLELTEPAGEPATIELLERGVRLVRQEAAWEGEVPIAPWRDVVAPLRVVVDADVLPTNASRSAVREDSGLLEQIGRVAPPAMKEATSALVRVLRGDIVVGDDLVEVVLRDEARAEAALGALACLAHGARRGGAAPSPAALELLDLPLLRDGVGRPRSLASLPPAGAVVHVWDGPRELPAEIEPWAQGILWRRGVSAERALADLACVAAGDVVADARKAAGRRRDHLARPPSPPSLGGGRAAHVLRETFRVEAGELAGLEGEVAVEMLDEGERTKPSVRVFVEQRPLATLSLARQDLPLPFEAAIAWPDHVGPTPAYDAVEDGQDLRVATWAAAREAALACHQLVEALDAPGAEADVWLRRTIRAAIGQLATAAARMGLSDDPRVASVDAAPRGALAAARVWPTTEPARWESVASISASAMRTGAVCTAPLGTTGTAIDGRPVIALPPAESGWLVAALAATGAREVVAVPYETALARGANRVDLSESVRAKTEAPAMSIEIDGARAVVAAARRPELLWAHAGAMLGPAPWSHRFGPVVIAVDDAELVPTPSWSAPRWHRRGPWIAELEQKYLETLVDALLGDAAEGALVPQPAAADVSDEVRVYLLRAALALRDRARRGMKTKADRGEPAQLLARVESIPFIAVLAADGRSTRRESLGQLALRGQVVGREADGSRSVEGPRSGPRRGRQPGAVPLVSATPGFETGDWAPVVCSDPEERRALERWFGPAVRDADADVGERRRAHDAEIAMKIVVAASAPGMGLRLFGDADALGIVRQALATGATTVAGACRSTALAWPTIQAGDTPLVDVAMRQKKVPFGRTRYNAWLEPRHGRSELDRPVLHVPHGAAGDEMLAVLRLLELEAEDVTPAVERLQAQRAAGPPQAPRLAGAPLHPALRIDLTGFAAGQVEIVPGPESEVVLVGLDGVPRAVPADVPISVRLVALVERDVADPAVQRDVVRQAASLATRQLGKLGASWSELPAFARGHLRALVCRAVANGTPVPVAHEELPIFEDTRGSGHTLASLRRRDKPVPVTVDPPPYPERTYDPPVVRVTAEELAQLSAKVGFDDQTKLLRLDRAGEERASAPPLDEVALSPDQRSRCPFVGNLRARDGAITGEVGILLPRNAGQRGIVVHIGRRRLCALSDEPGWPVCATIEARDVAPNRSFDGLAKRPEQGLLRATVRARATEILRASLVEPSDALASQWIETTAEPGSVQIMGVLWLPRSWPAAPSVTVWTSNGKEEMTLGRSTALPGTRGLVPVGGQILVRSAFTSQTLQAESWNAVAGVAIATAVSMLERARFQRRKSAPDVASTLSRYAWDLALLENRARGIGAAPIPCVSGEPATHARVADELRRAGRIWFTRRDGCAEGAFPDGPPPFVLVEDDGPGFRVLESRLAHGVLREVGGEPARSAPVEHAAPDVGADPIPAFDAPFSPAPELGPPDAAAPPPASWLSNVRRKLVAFFTREPVPPPPDPDPQLRLAVRARLTALALGDALVDDVVYARGGRPVRYDARRRTIAVDRDHPRLAPFTEAPDDRVVDLLVAAAVSELNRARTPITDAEELRAIGELLSVHTSPSP